MCDLIIVSNLLNCFVLSCKLPLLCSGSLVLYQESLLIIYKLYGTFKITITLLITQSRFHTYCYVVVKLTKFWLQEHTNLIKWILNIKWMQRSNILLLWQNCVTWTADYTATVWETLACATLAGLGSTVISNSVIRGELVLLTKLTIICL